MNASSSAHSLAILSPGFIRNSNNVSTFTTSAFLLYSLRVHFFHFGTGLWNLSQEATDTRNLRGILRLRYSSLSPTESLVLPRLEQFPCYDTAVNRLGFLSHSCKKKGTFPCCRDYPAVPVPRLPLGVECEHAVFLQPRDFSARWLRDPLTSPNKGNPILFLPGLTLIFFLSFSFWVTRPCGLLWEMTLLTKFWKDQRRVILHMEGNSTIGSAEEKPRVTIVHVHRLFFFFLFDFFQDNSV